MEKNYESLNNILKKYQKHLNIKLKLTCNNEIIFDDLLSEKVSNYLNFNLKNNNYSLISNSNIDLNLIKIAIEDYLIEDNYFIKALYNKLNNNELSKLKEIYKEENYYLLLIKASKNNEYLFSTISNIFTDECFELENNEIVVLCKNKYDLQYLKEVKDTLESELYCNVIIAVSDSFDLLSLSEKYNELSYLIGLSIKYNLENGIIYSSNLLLPYIIENIDNNKIKSIEEYIQINKIKELDEELLMTVIMFLKCNLSISETARKMYLHRNTLIYRIEKIHSITGYDIRNFDDALKVEIGMIMMKK